MSITEIEDLMCKNRDSFIALKEDKAFILLIEWIKSQIRQSNDSLKYCDINLIGAYRVRSDTFNSILYLMKEITEHTSDEVFNLFNEEEDMDYAR